MRRLKPMFVLLLLAPIVGEMLVCSTPLTTFFTPIPFLWNLGLYGCGSVLIREWARRNEVSWSGIVLMGAAYGIMEEGLQIQSFFNVHHADLGILAHYGRWMGVNFVWAQHLIGYHAIWSTTIPILLVDLMFPMYRTEPWLGRRGFRVIVGCFFADFVLGGLLVTAGLHKQFGTFSPLVPYLIAVLLVVFVTRMGLSMRQERKGQDEIVEPLSSRAPNRWLVRVFSFGCGFGWFFIMAAMPGFKRPPAPIVVMFLGALFVSLVWLRISTWSRRPGWADSHRLALATGPLLLFGIWNLVIIPLLHPQIPGKNLSLQPIVGLATVVYLIVMARIVRRREKPIIARSA